MGVSKFSELGFLWLWGPITLCADLRLWWGLKQSYIPHHELFNGMLHVTCTQGNWVDSWFLVVGSQIVNLTFNFSFGHNLYFRHPNGSCEPILYIYVPRTFHCCKKHLNPMSFGPYNRFLNIRGSIWDSNFHSGNSFGSVKVHSFTFFCTPMSTRCDFRASLLACNLASPCFNRKPKARVAIIRRWHENLSTPFNEAKFHNDRFENRL
jgi:hypothetical protein